MMTSVALQGWLTTWLSGTLQVPTREIDLGKPLSHYGLDSAHAVVLMAELSRMLERSLSPTLVFRYPTIQRLAAVLSGGERAHEAPSTPRTPTAPQVEPIAIIGISCRFPGAEGPEAFWRSLCQGVDAIREIPNDRWSAEALYHPDPAAPGKMVTRLGGFLDRIDAFDPLFFGISPREAREMDPQQRMMLELTWEALEDAGAPPTSLRGSRTGIFVGAIWQDYSLLRAADLAAITPHSATGRANNIIANRISYTLDLRGPSMVIDTACSASLVAVHLACQSLWSGESTMALAGGVNLMLVPDTMVALSKFGGLSPDGRSRAFDAGANGFARGEGCGVVVLKPLSRALAEGDPVYCVVRGSAVNNNGESNGLTAPSPWAQEAVLRDAWARADRAPHRAHYVEAHGTGTALGDPIEARALGAVLGEDRPLERPLRVGSVKTNIGHLEGAAGIAGLIKVALAIKHRALPPSLHFQTPNPDIPFDDLRIKVQSALEPWPHDDDLALAGVSAFGWGGTNAHIVLEEVRRRPAQLLPLSGESAEALQARAAELATSLSGQGSTLDLAHHCSAAVSRLRNEPHRSAITARSRGDLAEQLRAFAGGSARPGLSTGVVGRRRRLVFVCSPQGSAWWGMGRELLAEEPVFRAEIEAIDRALRKISSLSILDELTAPEGRTRLDDVTVVQPLLFALQAALVALLRSWGLEPDIIVGHSLGEIVAAYASEALDLGDAATLIHHHSRLYGRTTGMAGMAILGMPEAPLLDLLASHAGRISIAAYNSPVATVVSGETAALDELLLEAKSRGVTCSRIDVNIGGHSRFLDPLLEELRRELRGLTPQQARIPLMSTVTTSHLDGRELDAAYWARNMREPVLFSQTMDVLLAEGYDAFVEISPTPVLTHSIQQSISLRGSHAIALGTMRRGDERAALLDTASALYVLGAPVRWDRLSSRTQEISSPPRPVHLLPLSGKSPEALLAQARAFCALPAERPDIALSDLCYAASVRRGHHEHRLSIVADSMDGLSEHLRAFVAGESGPGRSSGRASPSRRKVVFVMAGQGAQWAGMGQELLAEEPVFRRALERCDQAVMRHAGWSLLDELARDPRHSRLNRTEIAQPALFAVEIALTALWGSWGVLPDAVIGHSVGEVVAAHLAGALSFDDAIQIVCLRGRVMSGAFGQGKMAAVELSERDASRLLRDFEGRIDLAAVNGPNSIVLSGEPAAIDAALQSLSARGVSSRLLGVEYAFHSAQMDPCAAELASAAQAISPSPTALPIFSTTTEAPAETVLFDAAHWGRNVRAPVRFAAAAFRALEQGYEVFVEIGPQPVLGRSLTECLEGRGSAGVTLPSLRRGARERQTMLESLGALYALGQDVDFRRLYSAPGRHVQLPTYPWQRSRFPLESSRHPTRVEEAPAPPEANRPVADRSQGDGLAPLDELFHTVSWEFAPQPDPPIEAPSAPGTWLILADRGGVGEALAAQLEARGDHCTLVLNAAPHLRSGEDRFSVDPARPEQIAGVIGAALGQDQPRCRGVVHLFGLDGPPPGETTLHTLEQAQQQGVCSVVGVVQALAGLRLVEPPSLWLVTRGCHAEGSTDVAVAQSPLWGLGQVIGYEHPELRCKRVDLSQPTLTREVEALARELRAGDREDQIALRENGRYIPRLIPYPPEAPAAPKPRERRGEELFRLEIPAPGALDRLTLRTAAPRRPGRGEIEIEVRAAGLNFLDVLIALDDYPDDLPEGARQLGRECAGVITAVGEGVEGFRAGQAVVAIAPFSFGSRVTTLAALAAPLPSQLTAEEGATLPISFLTSCYALEQVGRLRQGERVLIHAASGGTGMAALQVARRLGAEIFATAGNLEKRELLRSLGVEHVMDSRTLAFSGEVMARTRGEGVDVILNCLTGEAIPAGLSILRGGGRFCDISKRDIRSGASLGLGLFRKGISYSAINLGALIDAQPDLVSALLRDVISRVDEGALRPLPREVFPISKATEAFQRMARAEHTGKIVLSLQDREVKIERSPALVSADATYLITGGLGGLGLSVAGWMVEAGARHLVLVGRSAASASAEQSLAAMRRAGAEIMVLQADVKDRAQVVRVLGSIDQRWPLRGVVHAAGALDDGVILQLTPERILSLMAPKVHGAWNLHELTSEFPLDFFVLFSSAASLVGTPGQGSYAAANAFLDALARYRRGRGLPALSVQWGPWAGVGMAAAHPERGERLAEQGMESLSSQQALEALAILLASGAGTDRAAQIGVLRFDARRWCEAHAISAAPPLFLRLLDRRGADGAPPQSALRARLNDEVDGSARRGILELYLQEQAGRVLRLPPSQIEIHRSLRSLGLDSLMTLELRKRIEVGLGISLPATMIWDYPTITALSPFLLERIGIAVESAPGDAEAEMSVGAEAEEMVLLLEALEQLSGDDLAHLASAAEEAL